MVSGILSGSVFFALSASAGTAPAPGLALQIRLVNLAGVPSGVIAEVRREAARLFGHVGIRLRLLNCGPMMGTELAACQYPLAAGEILIELMPGYSTHSQILGFSLPGSYAAVFLGRADDLARARVASRGAILAHAIAHEAAHMLTGGQDHAITGVMHAKWGLADLQRIATRGENFSAKEGVALRAALNRMLATAAHAGCCAAVSRN